MRIEWRFWRYPRIVRQLQTSVRGLEMKVEYALWAMEKKPSDVRKILENGPTDLNIIQKGFAEPMTEFLNSRVPDRAYRAVREGPPHSKMRRPHQS